MRNSKFILGVYNVEDIIQIPGTKWIVGGGITGYAAGFKDKVITKNYLHIFDAEQETGERLDSRQIAIKPDPNGYPETTPPDWECFSPHGIDLSKREGDSIKLFACNHGGRESIEAFEIDLSRDKPSLSWLGAILAQPDFWPDALAVMPDGGLVVNSTGNPQMDVNEAISLQVKGAHIGDTRYWYPDSGWSDEVPGAENISTPNGILVSPDGTQLFICGSSGFNITRIDRSVTPPKVDTVDVGGIPDNIRWSTDGKSMLCGIHMAKPLDFVHAMVAAAEVGGNTPTPFKVTRIDAKTLELTEVLPAGVYATMGGGTGAIEVGNRLWVSTTKADRIAIFDLKK